MGNRKSASERSRTSDSRAERILWWIVAAAAALIPIFISPTGMDSFRLPKDLLFRAEGILLLGIGFSAVLLRGVRDYPWNALSRPVLSLISAAFLWTVVTTATSTNRRLSLLSLLWVTCSVVVFATTAWLGRRRGVTVVTVVLVPALVNAVVTLLQALKIWNPLRLTIALEGRFTSTALLGNPNDVGAYLVAPVLAAASLCLVDRSRRWLYITVALVIGAALIASSTLTAVVALLAGLMAMSFLLSRRHALVAALVVLALAFVVLNIYEPIRNRTRDTMMWIAEGSWDKVLSSRMVSFAAAAEMFRDYPLTGVGPGCFGYQFFPYKIAVQEKYPHWLSSENPFTRLSINFAEVHNDHLEILAETGILGYLIFLAALGVLAARSWDRLLRKEEVSRVSVEQKFSEVAALPVSVSLFVLALAQFPFQLAASTSSLLYVAALCEAWRNEPET